MQFRKIYFEDLGTLVEMAAFAPPEGAAEWHAVLHVKPRGEMFQQQYDRISKTVTRLLGSEGMENSIVVFKRYFLSDATNQQPLMDKDEDCAVSYIQQPPLDGSKLALWIYLQRGTEVIANADKWYSAIVRHNGYEHIWTMHMTTSEGSSYGQTEQLLVEYAKLLENHGMTLEDNCIRTWFFVRDVDTQYKGLVVARWENFTQHGLTPETHYIASTGIGGTPSNPQSIIQLGCYALGGFEPEQQRYLHAATHLNRTSDYGVTFERGTLLQFGDRDHAIISGTASINNKGEVMYVGDIEKQTHRMLENVTMLLKEADMTMDDVAQVVIYLRDAADYETVSCMFREKFPEIPAAFVLAPVCRTSWLIEMECIAIHPANHPEYRNF